MAYMYGWNFAEMEAEAAETPLSAYIPADVYAFGNTGVTVGEGAPRISGIQKLGDYRVRVVLTEPDATALYSLCIPVAPLHYYGDVSLYDYENDRFGFEKGDLSSVRAKDAAPLGAGPYTFVSYEDGRVTFKANERYYRGAPVTKEVQFVDAEDPDAVAQIVNGDLDIAAPSFTDEAAEEILSVNGLAEDSGSLSGKTITVTPMNVLGYGYVGISANAVNVGGKPGSDASKNLRKAFATVFAAYRDESVRAYFGSRAKVIDYPISDTSWAAPKPTDEGYKAAFSETADGKPIYTAGMTDEARYAAALDAALGYFAAAGYTVKNGKLAKAPRGAKMSYEIWIPADGTGNHPLYNMAQSAAAALKKIGMNLVVKDPEDTSALWDGIMFETVPMWVAAWGSSVDPDMYQIYFSGSDAFEAGGSNYMYDISDETLNGLILAARNSTDRTERKRLYKQCLDIILDWAVEVPGYQRQDAVLFSTERVDTASVAKDITPYYGWMNEIETLRMR